MIVAAGLIAILAQQRAYSQFGLGATEVGGCTGGAITSVCGGGWVAGGLSTAGASGTRPGGAAAVSCFGGEFGDDG